VPALSLGCGALGNLYTKVSDAEAMSLIDVAFQHGVNYFDTAPLYGLGLSENRLGIALAERPRDTFVVSTKVGRLLRRDAPPDLSLSPGGAPIFVDVRPDNPVFDFSFDGVLRSFEESLSRMRLDTIDIAYIHDPDDHLEDAASKAYRALSRLRGDGLIRAIGVGMNNADRLARLADRLDLDCVLLAGRYTLLEQGALDRLLPLCEELQTPVIIGGPFNGGILAAADAMPKYDYKDAPTAILERRRRLAIVCKAFDVPLAAASLQFPYAHPAVVSILTGARFDSEMVANVAAFALPLPDAFWSELRAQGLIDPRAPVPEARARGTGVAE
jgi:D-threo-aldose 1-dehydrogenase